MNLSGGKEVERKSTKIGKEYKMRGGRRKMMTVGRRGKKNAIVRNNREKRKEKRER